MNPQIVPIFSRNKQRVIDGIGQSTQLSTESEPISLLYTKSAQPHLRTSQSNADQANL